MHETIFLIIVAVAVLLLVSERVRPDLVAILIIVALYVTRLLSSEQALSGFSSEPAIVIASMFVLSAGFEATGLAESLGRIVGRLAGESFPRMLVVVMPSAALLSAATHHVMITALLLPVMLTLAAERNLAPSKLLMPMAIGSSLGTTITILGAPSFLIADQLLRQANRPGLAVFSIAPIGLALTAAGTAYMFLVGRFLLPDRRAGGDPNERFRLEDYVTELAVMPESPYIGKTAREVTEDSTYDVKVIGLLQAGRRLRRPEEPLPLAAGDVLLVRSTPDAIASIRNDPDVELQPVAQYGDELNNGARHSHRDADIGEKLVQAVVAPQSDLVGRTIGHADFRRRYGAVVLGLWRSGRIRAQELSRMRLRPGDVLVLEGPDEALARLGNERDFLMLVPFHGQIRNRRRAVIAGLVMLGTVLLAATGVFTLGMAAVSGALAMVLSGGVTPRQAYRAIDVRMFVFVAGAIPLGTAMKSSGTAKLLAGGIQHAVGGWPQPLMLLVLFLAVGVLVQFMGSDSATTALFGPVAIALAASLHQRPELYVVAIAMAAVTATLTPMAHHNLLIYGPGGYRFLDYARVGALLTIVLGVVVSFLAPVVWPA